MRYTPEVSAVVFLHGEQAGGRAGVRTERLSLPSRRNALLTLVNYTSRRSEATGGDDIFHTKGLICNLSCRNKAVRINNIPLINLSASGV